jgi:hypothetical protein
MVFAHRTDVLQKFFEDAYSKMSVGQSHSMNSQDFATIRRLAIFIQWRKWSPGVNNKTSAADVTESVVELYLTLSRHFGCNHLKSDTLPQEIFALTDNLRKVLELNEEQEKHFERLDGK